MNLESTIAHVAQIIHEAYEADLTWDDVCDINANDGWAFDAPSSAGPDNWLRVTDVHLDLPSLTRAYEIATR